jgi:hypothetical protein
MFPRLALLALCLSLPLPAAEPSREIPKDSWVATYFGEIDRATTALGLTTLRTATLPADAIEARFWVGFGLTGMRGYILQRKNGAWSGLTVMGAQFREPATATPVTRDVPWEATWTALRAKRLLTLPDFSTLPQSGYSVTDGSSFVVEVYAEGKYRTYLYPNSSAFDNPECREAEALHALAVGALTGRSIPLKERKFLQPDEVQRLSATLGNLTYPIAREAFLAALPVDLKARDLVPSGSTSRDGLTWIEWPLTPRTTPEGSYFLRATLARQPNLIHPDEKTLSHAVVVYHNAVLELMR